MITIYFHNVFLLILSFSILLIINRGRSICFYLFLVLIRISYFLPFRKKNKPQFNCWSSNFIKKEINNKLLEVKSNLFNFNLIIRFLFLLIVWTNYLGLLVVYPQNFLIKFSFRLLIISLSLWFFSYFPIITKQKEKLSLFIIGEIKFPPLSLLLSNIEILTHLFRPITLTARLWVNIWVGHLILRGRSFLVRFLRINKNIIRFLKGQIWETRFLIFECLIIFLQTFVFTYLIKVYFEENQHHSEIKI